MGRLDDLDLNPKLSRAEEAQRLTIAQARMLQLRLVMGGLTGPGKIGPPVLALFEGWDASGKGGAIKRLVNSLDPRHVRVAQFAAPTYDEKRHHFLWRFWKVLPGWGGVAGVDRSLCGGGLGGAGGARPLLVRAGARGARRGFRRQGPVGARVRRDRRVRTHPHGRGHD